MLPRPKAHFMTFISQSFYVPPEMPGNVHEIVPYNGEVMEEW